MIFRAYVREDSGQFQWEPLEQEKFRAICRAKFKGCEVEIELRERRQKRTTAQNKGFHAMITPWARDEGHNIDALKLQLLEYVFGTEEVLNPITGEVRTLPKKLHTSTLTVQEFSELVEQTLILAAECGVVLTAPDEYRDRHPEKYKPVKRQRKAAA